jgi:RNA polymerase sigma-70 factor (ECF subfamily)
MSNETTLGGRAGREFQPTAWTQIASARDGDSIEARLAWDQLIGIYWKPVYFHIRRKGRSVEDAKDLTQGFFAFLIEREALRTVDPAKGRFRSFVRACLENFLRDDFDRCRAAERRVKIGFDGFEAGAAATGSDFDRDWALAVMERAFAALREQAPREARAVDAWQSGADEPAQVADELGVTEANLRVLAHRGRKMLKERILQELRATVTKPGEEREELAELFKAFSL